MPDAIRDIMRGLKPGVAQTVGNMTVVPLVSDIVDDAIASPRVLEMETRGYGTVVAYNTGSDTEKGLTFSPMGNVIMTDKAAQNHVVPNMKIIKKGKTVKFGAAACVQERQGGLIPRARHRIMLLPIAMREDALDTRKRKNHGKLWASIREFNCSLGLQKTGHLEYFVKHYRKEMDEFIAQFEIIPRQVGAVILIGGQVVGVERCPNFHYFKTMWRPLIRECYGSYSIQAARAGGADYPGIRVPLSSRKAKSLSGIRKALARAGMEEEKRIKRTVNAFIRERFKREVEERTAGFTVETLISRRFKGQMVRKGSVPLMFSFVATLDWLTDPNQEKYASADEFRM